MYCSLFGKIKQATEKLHHNREGTSLESKAPNSIMLNSLWIWKKWISGPQELGININP